MLQLSLRNPLKRFVKSRMNMKLEQRRQAMLQLHLSDQQVYGLLSCGLYQRFDGAYNTNANIEGFKYRSDNFWVKDL